MATEGTPLTGVKESSERTLAGVDTFTSGITANRNKDFDFFELTKCHYHDIVDEEATHGTAEVMVKEGILKRRHSCRLNSECKYVGEGRSGRLQGKACPEIKLHKEEITITIHVFNGFFGWVEGRRWCRNSNKFLRKNGYCSFYEIS